MADSFGDRELASLAAELTRSLRDLRRELEPRAGRRSGPPTVSDLLRFTDEVFIPATILLLETNVRALKLLQRSIRLADERPADESGGDVSDRAIELSRATVSRLDDVLADVGTALEGRPPDDEARQVLSEARSLRDEIDDRLAERATDADGADRSVGETDVPVDVDAELASLKDELDEDGDTGDGGDGSNPDAG